MTNRTICCSLLNLFKLAKFLIFIEFTFYATALVEMYKCFKFDSFIELKEQITFILVLYILSLILEYYGTEVKNVAVLSFCFCFRLLQTISTLVKLICIPFIYEYVQEKFEG